MWHLSQDGDHTSRGSRHVRMWNIGIILVLFKSCTPITSEIEQFFFLCLYVQFIFVYVGFRELVKTANSYSRDGAGEGGPRRGVCGRYRKSRMLYTICIYKCGVRCTRCIIILLWYHIIIIIIILVCVRTRPVLDDKVVYRKLGSAECNRKWS